MPVIQISDADLYAKLVPWQQPSNAQPLQKGLNLGSATYGASELRASNDIQVMEPMIGFLVLQLTSGAVTVKTSIHQGTPNFASADQTISASGTGMIVSNRMVFGRNDTLSPGGNNFVSVQTSTAGGGAAVIARAGLLLCGMFPKGPGNTVKKGYHEAVYGINGLDALIGGVFDILLTF